MKMVCAENSALWHPLEENRGTTREKARIERAGEEGVRETAEELKKIEGE